MTKLPSSNQINENNIKEAIREVNQDIKSSNYGTKPELKSDSNNEEYTRYSEPGVYDDKSDMRISNLDMVFST